LARLEPAQLEPLQDCQPWVEVLGSDHEKVTGWDGLAFVGDGLLDGHVVVDDGEDEAADPNQPFKNMARIE